MTVYTARLQETQTPYSLRRRLMMIMSACFLVIFLALAMALARYARDSADQAYDLLLQGSAIAILESITQTSEGIVVDLPPAALEILALAKTDRVFYRVFDAKGLTLTGDDDLPLPSDKLPVDNSIDAWPVRYDFMHSGEKVRFLISGRPLIGYDEPRHIRVQLGQTRAARDAMQADIFWRGMVGVLLLTLVSLLSVKLAIDRAMQPLIGIETDIRYRLPNDFAALQVEPPREIAGLIAAINGFMHRLKTSRDNAQSFIADVAHQMRTALATLEGQLQLARQQPEGAPLSKRVEKAHLQTLRTIDLTNQLLTHAMVIHRADNQMQEQIKLPSLIRSALEETLRHSDSGAVEFEVSMDQLDSSLSTMAGDPLAMREALINLLRNAIQHAGPTSRIRVSLERHRTGMPEPLAISGDIKAIVDKSDLANGMGLADKVCLHVDDNGPGIPLSERSRVLDRFETYGNQPGSGIGLAIVAAVVNSHQGELVLDESPMGGLRVTMVLPLGKSNVNAEREIDRY